MKKVKRKDDITEEKKRLLKEMREEMKKWQESNGEHREPKKERR